MRVIIIPQKWFKYITNNTNQKWMVIRSKIEFTLQCSLQQQQHSFNGQFPEQTG